jgi:ribonucleoside-triphosphate reductase
MNVEDTTSMCCRLRLDRRKLKNVAGGLFGASGQTGSIGVVTLNLPRAAYKVSQLNLGTEEEKIQAFFKEIQRLMEIAKDSLELKRKFLEEQTDSNLYPYIQYSLRRTKERFGKYWQNHFSTIGVVGMHEALRTLFGFGIESKSGIQITKDMLSMMVLESEKFLEITGNNYNIEASPAEGTSYSLAKKDKDIATAKSGDLVHYYTNSTQLPVGYTDDIFELAEKQHEIQSIYTGGSVSHIFVGEEIKDVSIIRKLIKKVFENYKMPYLSITPTFSVCPVHGYLAGKHEQCPICEEEKRQEIEEQIKELSDKLINEEI